jgi:phosphatidate cytidylyltransferase
VRTRLLSAFVLILVVVFGIYLGGIPWLLGLCVAGFIAWEEMAHLLEQAQFNLDRKLGLVFVIAFLVDAYLYSTGLLSFSLISLLLTALIISSLIWALFSTAERPVLDWCMTVASTLYIGFLLSSFVLLRELGVQNAPFSWINVPPANWQGTGAAWMLVAMGLTWIADSAAFFVGSSLGRHKLIPRISPKKTWEGLAGGTLGVLIAGPILAIWLLGIPPWQGLVLGVLVAAADILGDLAISMFKRTAQTKDSSHLIPGHGGLLDRLDSLLFVIPTVTYFAYLVTGYWPL